MSETKEVLKVSSASQPDKVGYALASAIFEGQYPPMRAIGAGACNQMLKAGAIASSYAASRAIGLGFRVGFETVPGDEKEVAAMVMYPFRI